MASLLRALGNRKIEYARDKFLGRGSFGVVYHGTFQKESVAVKRIQQVHLEIREEEALTRLDHKNVVKMFHAENQGEFRLYALELCAASLDQVFLPDSHPQKYRGRMPCDLQVLLQLAEGLRYIHSMKLVHRDIKPQNVLISSSRPVQMKWADFGLCKSVQSNGAFSVSGIKGTSTYIAPEMLKVSNSDRTKVATTQSDVFSSGCLFFEFLTQGEHPFGSKSEDSSFTIDSNILKGSPVNIEKLPPSHVARQVIEKMLENRPENRITLDQIIEDLSKPITEMIRICSLRDPSEAEVEHLIRLVQQDGCIDDDHCVDQLGMTPLLLLCRHNQSSDHLRQCIKVILEDGRVDVNYNSARLYGGYNALHFLCWFYPHSDLIDHARLLIDKGIDVNRKTRAGAFRPTLLLDDQPREYDWNSSDRGPRGSTPLHLLCFRYRHDNLVDLVQLLIVSGVHVSARIAAMNQPDASDILTVHNEHVSSAAKSSALQVLKVAGTIETNKRSNENFKQRSIRRKK